MTCLTTFLSETFGAELPGGLPLAAEFDGPGLYDQHGPQIEKILQASGRANLIELFKAQHWRAPIAGAAAPGFVETTQFTEFYAPETHPDLPDLRIGLFYMGPNLLYPAHHHAAREVYVRLAGSCDFTLGANQDRVETGVFIIN